MKAARKRAFITGIAGFIGSHLAERLLSAGWEVSGIDDLSTGEKRRVSKSAKLFIGDIRDTKKMIRLLKGFDYCFHLAASARIQRSWDYPQETWDVNVNGTFSVLEAARIAKVKRTMITSSNSVYGQHGLEINTLSMTEDLSYRPMNPYAAHKVFNESQAAMFIGCYGMDVFIVRPFNVYGCHQPTHSEYSTVIPAFLEQAKKKTPLTVYGDGQQSRDFTHVFDIVEGMFLLMKKKKLRHTIYNIPRGISISILSLTQMFPKRKYVLMKSPRQGEMLWTKGSSKRLYKETGFKPTMNLKDHIKTMI